MSAPRRPVSGSPSPCSRVMFNLSIPRTTCALQFCRVPRLSLPPALLSTWGAWPACQLERGVVIVHAVYALAFKEVLYQPLLWTNDMQHLRVWMLTQVLSSLSDCLIHNICTFGLLNMHLHKTANLLLFIRFFLPNLFSETSHRINN